MISSPKDREKDKEKEIQSRTIKNINNMKGKKRIISDQKYQKLRKKTKKKNYEKKLKKKKKKQ